MFFRVFIQATLVLYKTTFSQPECFKTYGQFSVVITKIIRLFVSQPAYNGFCRFNVVSGRKKCLGVRNV